MGSDDSGKDKLGKRVWWQKLAAAVKKWVIVPLVGALLGALIIGRIINWVVGPKVYKVYLVSNLEEETTRQIWRGFSAEKSKLSLLGGIKVELESVDDLGDPFNARRISAELAERKDTLLIVGHIYSTQTKEALPAYLQQAEPPIPCILTTETNPNLLPPKISKGTYYPVFRLSPTDNQQAASAAQFAILQGGTSFWIVEDVSNPVYSKYLASKFIEQVQSSSKRVLLWSTNLETPSITAIQALNIDWVFFAGDWPNALILIRQLKAMSSALPIRGVILSDWSIDQRLIEQGGTDVEGVYLTHPLTAKAYAEEQYGLYGKKAFRLVEQLVDEGEKRFGELARKEGGIGYLVRKGLGIHRVADARMVLIALMEESIRTRHRFELEEGVGYIFENDGSCNNSNFHVWRVQDGRFADIQ
jgi:branched-chain amino acid transport system substrate-binding protein